MTETLTPREREVLILLSYGFGPREIADQLGITWWTVCDHRDNARQKLEAPTTTAAVATLLRAELTLIP